MIALIVICSVLAAALNAWSVVIQRYEAGDVKPEELFKRDLIKSLSKNPKWLGAFGLQVLAFGFQAAALRNGSLIVVQPIMTIDLVFLMLILHFHKHVVIGKREWAAIIMICIGLSASLSFANPTAGQRIYNKSSVFFVSCLVALIVAIGIFIVRRTASSSYRALISAIAAGFSFGLVDVFTKIVSRQLVHGPLFVLSHWPVWALCVTGITALIMTQNTYGAGPIAVSQPTMEIVEPLVGVALGIYIFGDTVNLSALNLTLALVAGLVACGGIVILSLSKRLQSSNI